jgi:multidrug efflux pump subunit AcrA (membrane-fusion protein)
MSATAEIVLPQQGEAVVVPEAAVRTDAAGTQRVFVVHQGKVESRIVRASANPALPGKRVVEEGLAAGEVVATSGLDRLTDGAAVATAQ